MPKSMRCFIIALRNASEREKIVLGYLTYHSGKLYNQALYLLQTKQAKLNMYDLYRKLQTSIVLKALHSRTAQIVLDETIRAYKNWLNYIRHPEKFKGKQVNKPRFRPKKKPHRTLIYDKTGFRIKGTKIRLSLSKALKKWLKKKHDIDISYLWIDTGVVLNEKLVRNIQIVPKGKEFEIHIIYEVDFSNKAQERAFAQSKAMVIDPNTGNFMVIGIEGVKNPFIIDGKGLKSLLRKYLRKIAFLQSKRDNLKNKGLYYDGVEARIEKLWLKIKRLLRYFAHTVSNVILHLAMKHKVTHIYIGNAVQNKNKPSKLSSLVDQMWSLLPHGKVKEYLHYKVEPYSIIVEYIDERFTSGVDSTLEVEVTKAHYTPEKREKRGLYRTVTGYLNADVNAVRNYLKKLGKFDTVMGMAQPVRIRMFKSISVSSLYSQIGGRSRGGVNLPVVIRHSRSANSYEALYL